MRHEVPPRARSLPPLGRVSDDIRAISARLRIARFMTHSVIIDVSNFGPDNFQDRVQAIEALAELHNSLDPPGGRPPRGPLMIGGPQVATTRGLRAPHAPGCATVRTQIPGSHRLAETMRGHGGAPGGIPGGVSGSFGSCGGPPPGNISRRPGWIRGIEEEELHRFMLAPLSDLDLDLTPRFRVPRYSRAFKSGSGKRGVNLRSRSLGVQLRQVEPDHRPGTTLAIALVAELVHCLVERRLPEGLQVRHLAPRVVQNERLARAHGGML